MRNLMGSTALAVLLLGAVPAFAGVLGDTDNSTHNSASATNVNSNSAQGGQGGTGVGIGVGKGGSAKSSASAGASAGAVSGSNSSAKQGQGQGQQQGQGQGQEANNSQEGDKTDINAYAISYADAAPPTVAATVANDVAVTTWGVKVLGPIFGMTDQHVHDLPGNVVRKADLVYAAAVNDGTDAGRARQHSTIVALCSSGEYEDLVELRFGDGACDNLNKLFNSLP